MTPAGVIATDPINADAARWLRAEIARRFNQPVRYLVYSHDHADYRARVAGKGAEIIKSLGLAPQAFDFGGCGGWI